MLTPNRPWPRTSCRHGAMRCKAAVISWFAAGWWHSSGRPPTGCSKTAFGLRELGPGRLSHGKLCLGTRLSRHRNGPMPCRHDLHRQPAAVGVCVDEPAAGAGGRGCPCAHHLASEQRDQPMARDGLTSDVGGAAHSPKPQGFGCPPACRRFGAAPQSPAPGPRPWQHSSPADRPAFPRACSRVRRASSRPAPRSSIRCEVQVGFPKRPAAGQEFL